MGRMKWMAFLLIFGLAGCSAMPKYYEYQTPTSLTETYQFLVRIRSDYDFFMSMVREEKLDGFLSPEIEGRVRDQAGDFVEKWELAVNAAEDHESDKRNESKETAMHTATDSVRLSWQELRTTIRHILGV